MQPIMAVAVHHQLVAAFNLMDRLAHRSNTFRQLYYNFETSSTFLLSVRPIDPELFIYFPEMRKNIVWL